MTVTADNIYKSFGDNHVLSGFSHDFSGITALMGVSGCGKTTLLRLIAGLDKPDNGRILFNSGLIRPPLSFAFAEPRLFPGATLLENVTVGGSGDGAEAQALLGRLGIGDSGEYPAGLSTGMAQRVSLARALIGRRELILLDEPYRGLDGDTRRTAMDITLEYTANACVIIVTHDPAEAEYLGAAILTMQSQSAD